MPYRLSRITIGAMLAVIIAAMLTACSQTPTAQPQAQPTATIAAPAVPPPIATPEPPPPRPTATTAPPAPLPITPPAPTATTAPEPTPEPTAAATTAEPAAEASGATAFVLDEGTIARYKVEETLARTGFTVATGETTEVSGRIVFDADGGIVADDSSIVMQAGALKTDSDRRDRYVRERTLQTAQFPEIIFRPTSAEGIPLPLTEAGGAAEFTISGDLTIRDQTRPVTWDVSADFGSNISGIAVIDITFDEFGMDKPSVAIVVSVEDTIRLELEFMGSIEQSAALNTDDADNDENADEAAYGHALGDADAPITVMEFSDFQ